MSLIVSKILYSIQKQNLNFWEKPWFLYNQKSQEGNSGITRTNFKATSTKTFKRKIKNSGFNIITTAVP